eukprot:TRINITY_DN14194_c0_g1_i1.p1 TRINITY_DN14194_c0_g1~~TRINITY_DN14194_c0_g1_i1.p1  ORF type:complete len:285 (-),score=59.95 TRINITY_DN14194_c0_g1_i1:52-906(-)
MEIIENIQLENQQPTQKYVNLQRWYCISKPQYKNNCGINSIASCWNYLFSKLGNGTEDPVSQEEVLLMMGYGNVPFEKQGFNPNNAQILEWFKILCQKKGVVGKARIFWKKVGQDKTNLSDNEAWKQIIEYLQDSKSSLIYHCFGHYFVPIGFFIDQIEQNIQIKADNLNEEGEILFKAKIDKQLIVGDQGQQPKNNPFTIAKFDDVIQDLSQQYPNTFNIRDCQRGVFKREEKEFQQGGAEYLGNRHCFIPVSYTHLRAHETRHDLVCRLLLEKKKLQIYTSV